MMQVKVLSSGSKGNSTLVITDQAKILIDVGVSYLYIEKELAKISLTPMDIDMVFITHAHNDHIKGLKTFLKKTGISVYIPRGMEEELSSSVLPSQIEYLEDVQEFIGFTVELIHTSHDAASSVGYIITSSTSSLVYVTDTGYINQKYLKRMVNKSMYIFESNHDEKMLMEGPYPYYLKQRVLSDSGHLSNKTAAKYLSTTVGDKTKYIILAHLSEKNNTEEIAYHETSEKLAGTNFHGEILIAKQDVALDLVEV